mmetsp:Transcript_73572/g.168664  ORF Transcript_73572/g.168664 Transcript_73572/m.168664 type:complete len:251 (+) Transcript_73572:239-991(+)
MAPTRAAQCRTRGGCRRVGRTSQFAKSFPSGWSRNCRGGGPLCDRNADQAVSSLLRILTFLTGTRITVGPTEISSPGSATEGTFNISQKGLECFTRNATGGRSSTHLSVADVSSALGYTTCEECADYPNEILTIDPRTKPECANASLEFPVVAVAESLCSPSSVCLGVCQGFDAFLQVADRDKNELINDTELLELGAMTGVSSVFMGMGACLGVWAECDRSSSLLSFGDIAVVATVFFSFDASDCSSCGA